MSENIFAAEQNRREASQNNLQASLKDEAINIKRNTVRINISLSEETNNKLTRKSKDTGISKSALIQHWIHENCD